MVCTRLRFTKLVSCGTWMSCSRMGQSTAVTTVLITYFHQALVTHGFPMRSFRSSDCYEFMSNFHYSIQIDLFLGHAALGRHALKSLSLDITGSHLTYSWSYFV